jgi:hypothetical protein
MDIFDLFKKKQQQLTTAELAQAIICINTIPEKFIEWFNPLLDIYLNNKKDIETANMLSFELGSARLAIYFLMSQKYYFKLYPYSSKLYDVFKYALPQYFKSIYGDNFEVPLSLFHIRLSSCFTAFESEDVFIQLTKQLHCHFNHCLQSCEPIAFKVTPKSDIMEYSLPMGADLDYCMQLINHLAQVANRTFEIYKIAE